MFSDYIWIHPKGSETAGEHARDGSTSYRQRRELQTRRQDRAHETGSSPALPSSSGQHGRGRRRSSTVYRTGSTPSFHVVSRTLKTAQSDCGGRALGDELVSHW